MLFLLIDKAGYWHAGFSRFAKHLSKGNYQKAPRIVAIQPWLGSHKDHNSSLRKYRRISLLLLHEITSALLICVCIKHSERKKLVSIRCDIRQARFNVVFLVPNFGKN
jgi:hypothetical protein